MTFFMSGDLTDKQRKIFMENQFYRGLSIPEPREMVSRVFWGLKCGISHISACIKNQSLH